MTEHSVVLGNLGGLQLDTLPSAPAAAGADPGAAVRQEVRAIQTDPQHPMHAAWTRRDPTVESHIQGLYQKAYGASTVEIGQGLTVGAAADASDAEADRWDPTQYGPNAREQFAVVDAVARRELGTDYDAVMKGAREIVRGLVAEHPDAFDTFSRVVRAKGPAAEVAALKFLAALNRL